MILPAILYVLALLLIGTLTVLYTNRKARQNELKERHARFVRLKNCLINPREAVEWLGYRLLGEASVFDNKRRHTIALTDMAITPKQLREMQIICLRLWWKQTNLRVPTIKEAINGDRYINEEIGLLTKWMETFELTADDLTVDVQTIKTGYMVRCCLVLEKGLYHYPDRAWHDWPAPIILSRLLEYWSDPEPERIERWNEWVMAAKKRHAHRLLTRLRAGCYKFPKSDNRVTQLLVYLEKAGANVEDIGTSEEELEKLRGFMPSKKKLP